MHLHLEEMKDEFVHAFRRAKEGKKHNILNHELGCHLPDYTLYYAL